MTGISFQINYTKSTWVSLDSETGDLQAWARDVLTESWLLVGRDPTAQEWDSSLADLLAAHTIAADLPGRTFAYWPSLGLSAEPLAYFDTLPMTDGSFDQLADFGGRDDPDNVGAAECTVLETPLGDAVKVVRYTAMNPDGADSPLVCLVTYLWSLPSFDGTVTLASGGADLDRMPTVIKALDRLATGLRVTLDGELLVATRRLQA